MFWYDISRTLSYNCLFNFVIGNRGAGKTYGAKKWAIQDFLKTGGQFIYVRRYKQELNKISKFFDDIRAEFPEVKLEVKGRLFYINGELAGQAVPLSTAKIEKSTPFPKVNKIIFDEFIIEKGVYHYLQDEVTSFLDLYETIARMRDIPVFFLSNAVTMTNPYFIYFNVSLPYGKLIKRTGDILIELVQNPEYIEAKKQTRFAQVVAGTQYEKYAIENSFLLDNKNFVARKTAQSEYYFTFVYNGVNYGVWADYSAGIMTVSEDIDPSFKVIYSLTTSDHSPNTMLIRGAKKSFMYKNFIEQYSLGNVRFESVKIKNIVQEVIKLSI